jgi:hypothetical protein
MRRVTTILVGSLFVVTNVGAQVVRGTVTERVSGLPLSGVVVTVSSVPDSLAPGGTRHTLTNSRGEYGVRLSSGGQFIVSAKRIGVARFTTPVLSVNNAETRRLDIALDPFEHKLPAVRVVEAGLCFRRNDQKAQVIALWDEVRTALIATGISREEQLLSGHLSRYVRTLEPSRLRILEDRRTSSEGLFERPMRSISGDSLEKFGYWGKLDSDTLVFYGPDDEALLSPAFRRGHCFELITGRDALRGFIGLGFRPKGVNLKGGIEGTLWIDAGNFELRFVEFRYTNLLTIPRSTHLGGQVHYDRHPSGAWFVRRWFIRMPVFPQVVTADLAAGKGSPRPTLWRILEEGGGLYTPGLRSWEKHGTITGVVTDSTGKVPLRETVVSLSGTPFSTLVDSLGRFRFDSIAPGAYTLLASHPAYAAFGQLADDEPMTLEAGRAYHASMRAITTTQLRTVVCDAARAAAPLFSKAPPPPPPHAATLRILVTHARSDTDVPHLPMWLRWRDPEPRASPDTLALLIEKDKTFGPIVGGIPGILDRFQGIQSMTDEIGGVTFCGVPAEVPLELLMLRSDDDPAFAEGAREVRITSFVLKRGELGLRSVSVIPPR